LTFTNSDWATQLAAARTTKSNVACQLAMDNGMTITNVGARYRGIRHELLSSAVAMHREFTP
jgi:hypothetical protein